MSIQERVNELANAALRSAPPSAGIPKPATFMPSFEQMRSADSTAAKPAVQVPAQRISIALNAFDLAFASATPGQG
ncbi:hypothetical protein [Haloferula sp. BvORR071]|uniref:hypothetical protein n=1 Tax=Haloferula sp. BvORR071 TaxID=1396141 RepID=UPI002240F3DF|nr:hypothetical protein [Haloferula sp. BvORR071]